MLTVKCHVIRNTKINYLCTSTTIWCKSMENLTNVTWSSNKRGSFCNIIGRFGHENRGFVFWLQIVLARFFFWIPPIWIVNQDITLFLCMVCLITMSAQTFRFHSTYLITALLRWCLVRINLVSRLSRLWLSTLSH